MKAEFVESFRSDWGRLADSERDRVRSILPTFNAACDRFAADPSAKWPGAQRVKAVEGAPGILEMTWSFSGPDGRATFEWITIDGQLAVRWRRIGGHAIFKSP